MAHFAMLATMRAAGNMIWLASSAIAKCQTLPPGFAMLSKWRKREFVVIATTRE
ncbi:hypothetical protein [Roseovarius sp. A46]|uniref:hypothetical protein n=1 Tax=Roseovarius sp. A46 TaxID=2109331 RepID=UPI0013E91024|nr:hypothetical protein [Roseovarius sp. A46]